VGALKKVGYGRHTMIVELTVDYWKTKKQRQQQQQQQ
jgi:hypothetical protein